MWITENNEIIQTLTSASKKQLVTMCNFAKLETKGTSSVLVQRLKDNNFNCCHWSKAHNQIVPDTHMMFW